jgi:hypothetical protein
VVDVQFQTVPKYGLLKSNITAHTPPLPLPTESFPAFQLFTPTKSPLLVPLISPLMPLLPLVANDPFPTLPKCLPLKSSITALMPPLLPPMESFPLFLLWCLKLPSGDHHSPSKTLPKSLLPALLIWPL